MDRNVWLEETYQIHEKKMTEQTMNELNSQPRRKYSNLEPFKHETGMLSLNCNAPQE
jgi:hypothetical protein